MGFRFDPYRRSMSFYPQLLSGRSGGLALSHSSRVMMSSILPVVFFTHCRCGPELRPLLMFLPGPVLSEYLANTGVRSEEHTSELQSRGHLVCRLLLEKKK